MSQGMPPALRAALPVAIVGVTMVTAIGVCVGVPCLSTGVRYGMWIDRCPATDMRMDLRAQVFGARRGSDDGVLFLEPRGRWLDAAEGPSQEQTGQIARGYTVNATLRTSDGDPVEGLEVGRLKASGGPRVATLTLPDIPDDDYVLHLEVDAGFDAASLDLELPLFAPALVHAMSDRPLYKPGQEVLLRSVILDRRDETPIPLRPGHWQIFNPEGLQVLDERDRTDEWGIADTSFPLDRRAAQGTWRAAWVSGEARDEISFDVRPFQLPRLTATTTPAQTWFAIGDDLIIEGRATYTSGAPVTRAPVQVRLRQSGRWPIPLAWEEPRITRTGRDGTFEISWGPVPSDLMEATTLQASAVITEQTGEAIQTSASLVLSPEGLQIEAVTEFGDGLVGDVNNRAYLRVATPDRAPLRDTTVTVRNPWDPLDEGAVATTDADGVVAVQLDPGDPVTVVHPAPPLRVRPFLPDEPRIVSATDGAGSGLGLVDRRGLDDLFPAIARCGRYAIGNESVPVALQVRASGTVQRVLAKPGVLSDCVARAMRRGRFEARSPRIIRVTWMVPDSRQPFLHWNHTASWGDTPLSQVLADAGRRARRCLTRGQGNHGTHALTVQWFVETGQRVPEIEIQRGAGTGLAPSVLGCLQRGLAELELSEVPTTTSLGQSVAELRLPQRPGQDPPEATTETAYQLEVVAQRGDAELGRGRLVLPVGHIPPIRLRATPSLALPGDDVLVEVFRGPDYGGDLPGSLSLMQGTVELSEVELDGNGARFTLPDDVRGFLHVSWAQARTVIYAQEPAPLTVSVATDAAAYRPGATAVLTVRTESAGRAEPAGVGLVGVDQALSQLAPLLAPDDMGRVTVRATSDRPAFGTFDPRALALGRVSGENAAKATLLRIADLPMDAGGDERQSAGASSRADTETELLTSFYRVLETTIAAVREWERSAPDTETLDPSRLVELYDGARATLRRAGTPAVDGFGRELTLPALPPDLLAQLEPQRVVSDATRLPEDLVSLERHVREEVAP